MKFTFNQMIYNAHTKTWDRDPIIVFDNEILAVSKFLDYTEIIIKVLDRVHTILVDAPYELVVHSRVQKDEFEKLRLQ